MKCGCHTECTDCVPGFQKVIDLKNAGLVIYRRRTETKNVNKNTGIVEYADNTTEDIYILHNTKDTDISSADYWPEIGRNTINCPRCRNLIEHAQTVLKQGPTISGNDVTGICDHCKMKDKPCFECRLVVKRFVPGKPDHTDIKKERVKHWLSKMGYLLQNMNKLTDKKKRAHSDTHIDEICHDCQRSVRKPDVEQLFRPLELDLAAIRRPHIGSRINGKNKGKVPVAHFPQLENLETPIMFKDSLKRVLPSTSALFKDDEVFGTGKNFSSKNFRRILKPESKMPSKNIASPVQNNKSETVDESVISFEQILKDALTSTDLQLNITRSDDGFKPTETKYSPKIIIFEKVGEKSTWQKRDKFVQPLAKTKENLLDKKTKELERTASIRKYHSAETLVIKIPGITEKNLKWANRIIFPRQQSNELTNQKSSSELIKDTKDKLIRAEEEKKLKNIFYEQTGQQSDEKETARKKSVEAIDHQESAVDYNQNGRQEAKHSVKSNEKNAFKAEEEVHKTRKDFQKSSEDNYITEENTQKSEIYVHTSEKVGYESKEGTQKASKDAENAVKAGYKLEKDVQKSSKNAQKLERDGYKSEKGAHKVSIAENNDNTSEKGSKKTTKDAPKATKDAPQATKDGYSSEKGAKKSTEDARKAEKGGYKSEKGTQKAQVDALNAEKDAHKFEKRAQKTPTAEKDGYTYKKGAKKSTKDAQMVEKEAHKFEKGAQKSPKAEKDGFTFEKGAKKSTKDAKVTEKDAHKFEKGAQKTTKAENDGYTSDKGAKKSTKDAKVVERDSHKFEKNAQKTPKAEKDGYTYERSAKKSTKDAQVAEKDAHKFDKGAPKTPKAENDYTYEKSIKKSTKDAQVAEKDAHKLEKGAQKTLKDAQKAERGSRALGKGGMEPNKDTHLAIKNTQRDAQIDITQKSLKGAQKFQKKDQNTEINAPKITTEPDDLEFEKQRALKLKQKTQELEKLRQAELSTIQKMKDQEPKLKPKKEKADDTQKKLDDELKLDARSGKKLNLHDMSDTKYFQLKGTSAVADDLILKLIEKKQSSTWDGDRLSTEPTTESNDSEINEMKEPEISDIIIGEKICKIRSLKLKDDAEVITPLRENARTTDTPRTKEPIIEKQETMKPRVSCCPPINSKSITYNTV